LFYYYYYYSSKSVLCKDSLVFFTRSIKLNHLFNDDEQARKI